MALKHLAVCHLGPKTLKIETYLPELVKFCTEGPYPLRARSFAARNGLKLS